MPSCAVPGCHNGTAARKYSPEGTRYYSFPKDNALALQWWHAIKREDSELGDHADPRVCSAHFAPVDFVEAAQSSRKRNLLPEAIPSVMILPTSYNQPPAPTRAMPKSR